MQLYININVVTICTQLLPSSSYTYTSSASPLPRTPSFFFSFSNALSNVLYHPPTQTIPAAPRIQQVTLSHTTICVT